MVNPVLTILFDLVLIGTALGLIAAMAAEYLASREPHVGSERAVRRAPVVRRTVTPRGDVLEIRGIRRRRAA